MLFSRLAQGRARFRLAPAVLTALLGLSGWGHAASLTVFAASSLTDAFTELGQAFDRRSGHHTTFSFAGSQVLRAQLEQGARADVLATANAAQYDPLVRAGLQGPGVPFARNRLTVITPLRSTQVRSLADLTRPGLKLVLAGAEVPAGSATRATLKAIAGAGTYGRDYATRVLANVVSEEPNVRQVALKVALGQADAALVYVSDVTPALKKQVRTVALPGRFNPPVSYPIGVATRSREPEAARAFVAFVRSAEGQRILRRWGFLGVR
ncbi:molybdate ABC transporter substrate-binding protein [Deinococcus navajonensis]|uniref:Molybdate ABC transporter substrate-binding protein n=1 Tax=Deinococcus navajonensis TaxID=309884 RepID=A0ABV8XI19_9DEIO